MKKIKLFVVAAMMAIAVSVSCTNKGQDGNNSAKGEEQAELADADADSDGEFTGKGLNEIRFENFKEKDWLDNDYIRALRRYIDDFRNGHISEKDEEPTNVEPQEVKGQFIVANVGPCLGGGLFVYVIFIDNPECYYSAWIYSFVDVDTETITGYSVRMFNREDDKKTELTREQILNDTKEHPELKLW
ncbi:MAG: hypothetical protein K2J86_01000 [Prevotella sp.]|nr:hypothetical protein [Prevotella sp.]